MKLFLSLLVIFISSQSLAGANVLICNDVANANNEIVVNWVIGKVAQYDLSNRTAKLVQLWALQDSTANGRNLVVNGHTVKVTTGRSGKINVNVNASLNNIEVYTGGVLITPSSMRVNPVLSKRLEVSCKLH